MAPRTPGRWPNGWPSPGGGREIHRDGHTRDMISEERYARANTGNHKFTDQPPSSNRDARARQAPGTHDTQHGVSPGAHTHTPTRPHAQHTRSSGCGGEDSLHSNAYSSCGLSGIRHGAHSEAAAADALNAPATTSRATRRRYIERH